MELNTLNSNTKRLPSRRVGRGGKRGKTSGRGTKGQKARAGHRIRPEIRDIIKKIPKRRGYHFTNISEKASPVSLSAISSAFTEGATVSPATLVSKGLLRASKGNMPRVKILGGQIDKKITVSDCSVSASVREKIVKAGGSVADLPLPVGRQVRAGRHPAL